jgi:hypothetical protein
MFDTGDDGCVPHGVVCAAQGTRVTYDACNAVGACVFVRCVARVACGRGAGLSCGLVIVSFGQVIHGSCAACSARCTRVVHVTGDVTRGEFT